jgi:hypothetical protein
LFLFLFFLSQTKRRHESGMNTDEHRAPAPNRAQSF